MDRLVSVLVVLAVFAGCTALLDVRYDGFRITLHVFSGTPDPTWEVRRTDPAFYQLERKLQGHSNTAFPNRMGYTGFTIDWLRGHSTYTMTMARCSDPEVELFLVDQLKALLPVGETRPMADSVVDYLHEDIQKCP